MNYSKAVQRGAPAILGAFVMLIVASPSDGRSRALEVVGHYEGVTRVVSYTDLDLASASAERTLKHRVSNAVNEVCSEAVGQIDSGRYLGCTSDAWRGARPQIAQAVQRAHEIAATGTSAIVAAAITINLGK
jgi:UrcA family protein